MSVYTELTHQQIDSILNDYQIGKLLAFKGIAAGIENSNFFIDTEQGRYVLTIFERMNGEELPYFMRLMAHLSAQGVTCPDVAQRSSHEKSSPFLFEINGKQGAIVSCMPGQVLDHLNEKQLYSAAAGLAKLHLAGSSFPEQRKNPTDLGWLTQTIASIQKQVDINYGLNTSQLLNDEINWQQQQNCLSLPTGVIHGDYFCDNILFEGEQLSGIIDFYYAHTSPWIMDLAIAVNALAIQLQEDDSSRMKNFLDGYQSIRALTADEQKILPAMLRLSALRFWVSRLYDALNPREGAMTQIKDPKEYEYKLRRHRQT
ncbi:MAG: homoserine kinase [Zetaproteobacteria bacterium]|nr:homoserine kinase [Zetaproteobacteria bacterium]